MRHRRPIVATLLALGVVVSAASGVMAKGEGARLILDDPLPIDAPAGSDVEIAWTLVVMDTDGTTEPFSALGLYVRLIPTAGSPVEVTAREDRPGHYVASVTVPPGGLGAVIIGLQGTACMASGECSRSDEIFMSAKAGSRGGAFPIERVADPPTAGQESAGSAALTPARAATIALDPALVVLGLLGGAGVLGAVVLRRRRRPATA